MRTSFVATVVLCASCSPRVTQVGEFEVPPPTTLSIIGRVCTPPMERNAFPVKVVLLVDQSAAACVIDPPGAQSNSGFCTTASAQIASTATRAQRIGALHRLLDSFATRPEVAVALVPFETNVKNVYPREGFVPASDRGLRTVIDSFQAELGEERDFQGALANAQARIAADIDARARTAPMSLALTRYVVVLLSVGPPRPTCAANDNLTIYADDLHPLAGPWPDTDSDGCNLSSPVDGFAVGGARNQTTQLAAMVEALAETSKRSHVGEFQLHTMLLTNLQTWGACGPTCEALFGNPRHRFPGSVPVSQFDAIPTEARLVLRELATRGGGSFLEFATSSGQAMTFDPQRFDSLLSPNVLRELIAEPRMAVSSHGDWMLDEDGDGVSNSDEFIAQTDPLLADTDGDGFSDRFELDRVATGFDAKVKDLRGCDPLRAETLNCRVTDTDGDGASNVTEAFLHTDPNVPDSDLDGFVDGLELKFGLDPTVTLASNVDIDGDGVPDADELRRGSHPRQVDPKLPLLTTATRSKEIQADGSSCYEYLVTGLPMLEGSSRGSRRGVNLFKLWFASVPEKAPRSYGSWKAACVVARRDASMSPPTFEPPQLMSSANDVNFRSPSAIEDTRLCVDGALLTP